MERQIDTIHSAAYGGKKCLFGNSNISKYASDQNANDPSQKFIF